MSITATNDQPFQPERLRQAMDAEAVTQTDLADRLKVSPRTVRAWLTGGKQPDGWQLLDLQFALRQPVAFYFCPPISSDGDGPGFACQIDVD